MTSPRFGIEQLTLSYFRCYDSLSLVLDRELPPVVLTGSNGAGKTNVLEALSFLVPGRGLRNAHLADISYRIGMPDVVSLPKTWAVSARVRTANGVCQIGTGKTDQEQRRQIRIDGQNVKSQDELGKTLSILWLTPAFDRIFNGDPATRRRFLDRLVQSFLPSYAHITTEYAYAFKQWMSLLCAGKTDPTWLVALEQQISQNGVAMAAARVDVVDRLNMLLEQAPETAFPRAQIFLKGAVEDFVRSHSALQAETYFADTLANSRHLVADGGHACGPHTADLSVLNLNKNTDASLCSTGEQKALLLSIIFAQTQALMKEKGQCPLLLLDEGLSHLDAHRQGALFELILSLPSQVWLTGVDEKAFAPLENKAEFFCIDNAKAYRAVA